MLKELRNYCTKGSTRERVLLSLDRSEAHLLDFPEVDLSRGTCSLTDEIAAVLAEIKVDDHKPPIRSERLMDG